jgi:hypothetical protein
MEKPGTITVPGFHALLPTAAAYAFVTLPADRQRVHTRTRWFPVSVTIFTRRRFGSQRRSVLLFA